jgi:hypothetical protein
MPFSQATIVQVNPPTTSRGETLISWVSTSPAGTWFQFYVNRKLSRATKQQYVTLPSPGDAHYDIGTVADGEQYTDFSASLPTPIANRVELTWEGGSFLDPSGNGDVAGFRVFGPSGPGVSPDLTTPLATIPAYTGPGTTDGYGMGGYGAGGYGAAAGNYSWESDALWSGDWTFAVAAFDREGDLGTVVTATITLNVPPREPGWKRPAPRLTYIVEGYRATGYGSGGYGESCVLLDWLPSPG